MPEPHGEGFSLNNTWRCTGRADGLKLTGSTLATAIRKASRQLSEDVQTEYKMRGRTPPTSAMRRWRWQGGVPRDPEGPAYYTSGQPLKQPYPLQVELLLQAMTKLSTGSRLLLRWEDRDADVPTPRVSWATFLAFVESEEGTCFHVHYKCHGAAQPGPGSCGGALVTPEGALIGLHCGAKPEVSNPDD
eukprot:SAG31_NODE_9650_length_1245_cov_3.075916_1_plen_188_part_10